MAHSKPGTRPEATELQEANDVQMPIRGAWYHVSKDKALAQFRDDHPDDWIFLTRSPGGGTNWGDRVLEVFVVEPVYCRLYPPDNKGDAEGWHQSQPLPGWWMIVQPTNSGCLMVTGCYHLLNDSAYLDGVRDSADYKARRAAAIEALKQPSTKGPDRA
jgi:hypothetical protein